jgi:hypothetical protein
MTMLNLENTCDQTARRPPWNKGKLLIRLPLRAEMVEKWLSMQPLGFTWTDTQQEH